MLYVPILCYEVKGNTQCLIIKIKGVSYRFLNTFLFQIRAGFS